MEMGTVRAAAERALLTLRRRGEPPADLDRCIAWCWRKLGVDVRWCDQLPPGVDGFCYSTPSTGIRGRVLLSPSSRYPRYTLAHEVGHLVLANGAAFSLACHGWQMLPAEREANAYAAMLTIPLAEVTELFREDWTCSQVAARYGVPVDALLARLQLGRLLSEVDGAALETRLDRLSRR